MFLNEQPTLITEDEALVSSEFVESACGRDGFFALGLANSNNWISARLMDKLSPSSLARLMHSFGIKNKIDEVISLCLGPVEVSVEEMVTAYTAFFEQRRACRPFVCDSYRG